MKSLADLRLFVRTAETGSLSAAARLMDLSPAVASASLKRLERELDVQLFVRSTRSLRLTTAGERFLVHASEALRNLDEGTLALQGDTAQLRGELRISAPSDLGRSVLLPWLDSFQKTHPQLHLRFHLSDRIADVHRQAIDIALRYGNPPESALVALPLAPDNRRVLVGAPDYLEKHGTPRSPADLVNHNCLRFMLADELHAHWRFTGPDGATVRIEAMGDRISDDGEVVRRWAIAGVGIAYKSWLDVAEDVAQQRLRVLCPAWRGEVSPLNLVSPHRRLLSPAVHRLREFLQARCASVPQPPGT